jgi:hypothetical protein
MSGPTNLVRYVGTLLLCRFHPTNYEGGQAPVRASADHFGLFGLFTQTATIFTHNFVATDAVVRIVVGVDFLLGDMKLVMSWNDIASDGKTTVRVYFASLDCFFCRRPVLLGRAH